MSAGDTLWVCGEHDTDYPGGTLAVGASGTSARPITVRGDCSSVHASYSDGIIWNLRKKYPKGYRWKGPDAHGVYSAEQYGQSNDLPAIEDKHVVLTNAGKLPDSSWKPGSYFHAPPVFYYKPSRGTANAHLVYSSVYEYSFRIFDREHILLKNIDWKMGGSAAVAVAGSNNISLENLGIQFARYGVQVPNNGTRYRASHACSLINSTIHDAGSGIYFTSDAGIGDVSTNWTISGNRIYNINRPDIKDPDRHAIGVQGARHFMVADNVIHDIGGPNPNSDKAAIDFYSRGPDMHVDNNVVTRNLIFNARYGGIALESNNSSDPEKMKNNLISYNVVKNGGATGDGISWKSFRARDGAPSVRIFNNTVAYCADSYKAVEYAKPGDAYVTAYDFRNNISLFPVEKHFVYYPFFAGRNRGSHTAITHDHNLYFPDGKYFVWNPRKAPITFAQFKATSGKELHSLAIDPLIVSTSDFHLRSDSPAIDAAAPVGLTTDHEGKKVPFGEAPDIGAYEFSGNPE